MSTDLVSTHDLDIISQRVAKSGLFGMQPEQVFTLCLVAQAEGLQPIEAMRRFHIIEGKPSMRADAMQAEFQRHGGTVEWVESTREVCEAVFTHPVHAKKGFTVRVTFAELSAAGVTSGKYGVKDNWKKFPRQMLRARAISEGVRAVDPGIVVGIYTPEEISDFDRRDVSIETTARVVTPEPAPKAKAVADELGMQLAGQLDAPRVQDRHAPVEAVVAELAPAVETPRRSVAAPDAASVAAYAAVVFDSCKSVNAFWSQSCEEEGVTGAPDVVVNQFQVENHLASWATENKPIKKDHFANEKGLRDRPKVVAFLAKWCAKYPDEFTKLTHEYCTNKLKEACNEHGILLEAAGENGDGEGEAEFDQREPGCDDDVSQDVESEVLA